MDESSPPLSLRIPDLRERFHLARNSKLPSVPSRATAELFRPANDHNDQASHHPTDDESHPTSPRAANADIEDEG